MKPMRALLFGLSMLLIAAPARAAMEVYDVDPRYRQEVYAALLSIFPPNVPYAGTSYPRIGLLPTGQILVDAPDDRQAQIAAVLAEIARRDPAPTPRVTLRYWVLQGSRNQAVSAPPPPILDGVVAQLQAVHGDVQFTLLDSAALVSEAGQAAELENERGLSIEQTVYPSEERVDAEIRIARASLQLPAPAEGNGSVNPFETVRVDRQELEMRVALTPGEFLVLGESTVETRDGSGIRVFVVHWPSPD